WNIPPIPASRSQKRRQMRDQIDGRCFGAIGGAFLGPTEYDFAGEGELPATEAPRDLNLASPICPANSIACLCPCFAAARTWSTNSACFCCSKYASANSILTVPGSQPCMLDSCRIALDSTDSANAALPVRRYANPRAT